VGNLRGIESGLEKEKRVLMKKKIDPILNGLGPIVLNFSYISEELTDKSN
jgi:hypothetical protein